MGNFSPKPGILHPDQPPDLDKYSFVKEIGRGSFSTVYLAVRLDSDSEDPYVAIKVIQRRKITKKLEFHLRQEISILKKLNEDYAYSDEDIEPRPSSMNIIKFYEMIKCKSVICLVMEWCSYSDLTNLLMEQKQVDKHHFAQLQILQRKNNLRTSSSYTQKNSKPNKDFSSQLYWTREANVKDFIIQLGTLCCYF